MRWNMILNKNKDILSIIQRELNYAQCEDVNAEYEIELGSGLLYEIISQQEKMYYDVLVHHKDSKSTLFGEALRINYDDPFVFKLWKNIV